MTRRKQREPNQNPLHEIKGAGAAIRAGGGGHIRSVYYDDEPMRPLKGLPPRRFPPVISAVPTLTLTPEARERELARRRPVPRPASEAPAEDQEEES